MPDARLEVEEERRWRAALRDAVRDPAELFRLLELPEEAAPAGPFGLLVPRGFVARMRRGDPHDPLLRQVLPVAEEQRPVPGWVADPLGEAAASPAPGMLHKYAGRALLLVTGACAVHCRYCFRREYPYAAAPRSVEEWAPALERLAADTTLEEVILSGGDPLVLRDRLLAELTSRLAEIGHLSRLRIHTRLPIVLPERVTGALVGWLRGTRLVPWVVVHANHPAELDDATGAALARLVDAGVPLLNQAVLLRGVNDDAGTLAALCRRLVDLRVQPYYLHQLDRVAGAAQFDVPVEEGRRLVAALRARLPGYAVPRHVVERAGAPAKLPLEPELVLA